METELPLVAKMNEPNLEDQFWEQFDMLTTQEAYDYLWYCFAESLYGMVREWENPLKRESIKEMQEIIARRKKDA